MKIDPSGSQTVGPFYTIGLAYLASSGVPTSDASATTVTVRGRIFDANGAPVPDAMLELWQADPDGSYAYDMQTEVSAPMGAQGFARVVLDDQGGFSFTTVKPGPVPFGDGRMQAPHIVVLIFMRGLLRHLITRLYFPDEPANTNDPILQTLPEDRRNTVIARRDAQSPECLKWSIILQGEGETVFFAW